MKLGQRFLIAALSAGALTGCAATISETKMQTLVAGQRVQPPQKSRNNVYVDFSDHTGEGGEFEDSVYEAICAPLIDRLANGLASQLPRCRM